MKQKPQEPAIAVFFDGLCPLCSREIEHYRRQPGAQIIRFVDITEAGFDPEREGVNPRRVHEVLHVRGSDGKIHTGVEAFIQIWGTLPGYAWAASWANRGPVKIVLMIGYGAFARLRPLLPRRSRAENCAASPYCERK